MRTFATCNQICSLLQIADISKFWPFRPSHLEGNLGLDRFNLVLEAISWLYGAPCGKGSFLHHDLGHLHSTSVEDSNIPQEPSRHVVLPRPSMLRDRSDRSRYLFQRLLLGPWT